MSIFSPGKRLLVIVTIASTLFVSGLFVFASLSNTITPKGIVIHHSALPSPHTGRQIDASDIELIHKYRGFRAFYWGRFYHIGYHYVILPDGTIQQGRPDHCTGAHTVGYNSYIGICLIGDFSSKDNPFEERGAMAPTDKQLDALTRLCSQLQAKYHIAVDKVMRHSDINPNTQCPGDRFPFDEFLRRLVIYQKNNPMSAAPIQ